MAISNRTILKTYFQTGDVPTEEQFAALIDSLLCLQGSGDGIATAAGVDGTSTILVINSADGNIYKTTLGDLLSTATLKNKTWTIKDQPSSNPADMQKQSGDTLTDNILMSINPMDVMIINNVPLQWYAAGVTYNSNNGFDFTAIGGLQNNSVITISFI